jgi:hypothetical protein
MDDPRIGEEFVWLEAAPSWGEQVEIVRGVAGSRPGGRWFVEWWEDGDERQKMITMVKRNAEGRLVRAS